MLDDDVEIILWPNCVTPDCKNGRCMWSGTPYCYPCAERLLGTPELERRYDETHPEQATWPDTINKGE